MRKRIAKKIIKNGLYWFNHYGFVWYRYSIKVFKKALRKLYTGKNFCYYYSKEVRGSRKIVKKMVKGCSL